MLKHAFKLATRRPAFGRLLVARIRCYSLSDGSRTQESAKRHVTGVITAVAGC
jgi:hypothetical protein